MNVSCTKCGKRYVVADEKIVGKTVVKIRCKQCQTLIAVPVPQAAAGAAVGVGGPARAAAPAPAWAKHPSAAAPPPLDPTATWHAMVQGRQIGPLDVKQLGAKIMAGEVTQRTYLWKPGMADWKRAWDLPEVGQLFVGAPPQPERPGVPSKAVPAVQRDVALANEAPAPEVTSRPAARHGGNGNGNGHGHAAATALNTSHLPPQPPPRTGVYAPVVRPRVGVATPVVEPSLPAPAPQPAPVAEAQAPQPSAEQPLNDLFKDISGQHPTHEPNEQNVGDSAIRESPFAGESPEEQPKSGEQPKSDKFDPFAALAPPSQSELPPPGEATRFFIAQAGLNERNPPWKIALFLFGLVGVPTLALYLLSTFHIVSLPTVTRTTDDGTEVQESFFSAGGISGLKDSLTGEAKRRRAEAERRKAEAAAKERDRLAALHRRVQPERPDEVVPPKKPVDPDLAHFYGENTGANPRVPKNRLEGGSPKVLNNSGLSQEAVSKTIADKVKGFQACIDNALRRNPNLAVGAITVVLNVGPSGAVKSASVEPKKHEGADWAQCMMSTGKRVVFPSSDGETQVELPFKVGVALAP